MNDLSRALGLIEVIGYPTAITAADAALKASNVNLSTISKVGSGIMTIQLIGDVAAVRSAVEAGAAAAKEIGVLRYTHVIPRYDTQLLNKLVKDPGADGKNIQENKPEKQVNGYSSELTEDELRSKTNADLKNLINALEIKTDEQFLKTAKKDDLITTIMSNSHKKEEDNGIDG